MSSIPLALFFLKKFPIPFKYRAIRLTRWTVLVRHTAPIGAPHLCYALGGVSLAL